MEEEGGGGKRRKTRVEGRGVQRVCEEGFALRQQWRSSFGPTIVVAVVVVGSLKIIGRLPGVLGANCNKVPRSHFYRIGKKRRNKIYIYKKERERNTSCVSLTPICLTAKCSCSSFLEFYYSDIGKSCFPRMADQ